MPILVNMKCNYSLAVTDNQLHMRFAERATGCLYVLNVDI